MFWPNLFFGNGPPGTSGPRCCTPSQWAWINVYVNRTSRSVSSPTKNFARNFGAPSRLLGVDGIFAGDGVLGADRVEAPRLPDARRASSGNGCRVLTVGGFLLSRGLDMSDHHSNEDDDEDSDYDSQTDGQGYRHWRVVAGWRRCMLSGWCRIAAFNCSRSNYEHKYQTVGLAIRSGIS